MEVKAFVSVDGHQVITGVYDLVSSAHISDSQILRCKVTKS